MSSPPVLTWALLTSDAGGPRSLACLLQIYCSGVRAVAVGGEGGGDNSQMKSGVPCCFISSSSGHLMEAAMCRCKLMNVQVILHYDVQAPVGFICKLNLGGLILGQMYWELQRLEQVTD